MLRLTRLTQGVGYIREDLVRASFNARRMKDHRKWKQQFNLEYNPIWRHKDYGELVFIYQQGWGPRKRPRREWRTLPALYPVPSYVQKAKLSVINGLSEMARQIYNVETIAIKTLNDQYAPLIAKRLAGVITKEIVADQIRQSERKRDKKRGKSKKNKRDREEGADLGTLVGIGLHLADRADLRQWSTLPKTFQVAKIRLKAGKYKIKAQGYYTNGKESNQVMPEREVTIKPQRKTFFTWRTFK